MKHSRKILVGLIAALACGCVAVHKTLPRRGVDFGPIFPPGASNIQNGILISKTVTLNSGMFLFADGRASSNHMYALYGTTNLNKPFTSLRNIIGGDSFTTTATNYFFRLAQLDGFVLHTNVNQGATRCFFWKPGWGWATNSHTLTITDPEGTNFVYFVGLLGDSGSGYGSATWVAYSPSYCFYLDNIDTNRQHAIWSKGFNP
jgi:hypothetical protein